MLKFFQEGIHIFKDFTNFDAQFFTIFYTCLSQSPNSKNVVNQSNRLIQTWI